MSSRLLQNQFVRSFLCPNFDIEDFKILPHFLRKWFHLPHSKTCKRLKNALLKRSQHLFFSSRLLQIHFLRRFLYLNFDLNSFEWFASHSQKTASTMTLKCLEKTEKCFVQMLRTFVFELKVALKPFSSKFPMTKFWSK